MISRKTTLYVAVVLLLGLLLAACGGPEVVTETVETVVTRIVQDVVEVAGEQVEVTRIVTDTVTEEVIVTATPEVMAQPVTLHINLGAEPPSLDPSLATDTTSVDVIRNIFVGLTQFDPVTGEVSPYLAESWESGESEDGHQTWTFHLRADIPWVRYDPLTGETSQISRADAEGNDLGPAFVNAHDVVYAVMRTVDPATASSYSYVLYNILNAAPINGSEEGFTIDQLGVTAIDDWTVQFTLEDPAGYFPAIAGMWIANPEPQWTIDEHGAKWTEAGLINTNGPMVLDTWIHGGEIVLVKNPLFPMADAVQIERIEAAMIVEESTSFALYENNELDTTSVPSPELDRVRADSVLSAEYVSQSVLCTYYYGFTNTKPPFDDARVRQAFSQSLNRQALIDNVLKAGQTPATSFAPPGIFGAPEPGTVGVTESVEEAQAALQSYLDENSMTIEDFNAMDIVLMHNTSEAHARIAAAAQQMWADALGVTVRIENQEWLVYLNTIDKATPVEQAPHIWRLGWCADYPDENNWVHEVFSSVAGGNSLRRNCVDANCSDATASEFDELTVAAGQSQDPAERIELYAQAEEILAGVEYAYAPIYHYTSSTVTKPWLTRNFPPLGGNDWFNWTIDVDAKLEATGG